MWLSADNRVKLFIWCLYLGWDETKLLGTVTINNYVVMILWKLATLAMCWCRVNMSECVGEWILFSVPFCTLAAEGGPKSGICPTLLNDFKVLYSVQYHRQHCTLQTFEQFGALYMHNHARRKISDPNGIRTQFRATAGQNEPSGPALVQSERISNQYWCHTSLIGI